MSNIYIVRHGETVWNTERRMQGQHNSSLTDLGKKQAIWLADRVREYEIDVIVTSPLKRALNTAQILKGIREIEIIENKDLMEIYLGCWQGKRIEDVREEYPKKHDDFWNSPSDYVPVDGESFIELRDRVEKVFQNILETYANKNVMIVAHSIVIKSLFNSIRNDGDINKLWEGERIGPTSLSLIQVDGDKINVDYVGDVSHYLEVNEVGGWFVDK